MDETKKFPRLRLLYVEVKPVFAYDDEVTLTVLETDRTIVSAKDWSDYPEKLKGSMGKLLLEAEEELQRRNVISSDSKGV